MGINQLEFANPEYLFLLAIIPLMVGFYFWKRRGQEIHFTLPSTHAIENIVSWRVLALRFSPVLRILAIGAFILAIARPQLPIKEEEVKAEGIDIMLIMDLSSSMLAQDFEPDRLSVSKEVAKEFVDKRRYDRLGLVVFAGESFTQCPLTTDHRVVKDFLDNLQCGILEDGTAIGMGLASAVNRLKDSDSKSKVIILLTDGVNNAGYIQPKLAANIARDFDVKVYTIGVGSMGQALSPVSRRSDGVYIFGMARVEIDEALLRDIAQMTGGVYYRATNEESLEAIYAQIDQLEKTEIEMTTFNRYHDEFRVFLAWGFILFLGDVFMRLTLLKTLP